MLSFPRATSSLRAFEDNLKNYNSDQIERFVDAPSPEDKESLQGLFEHKLEPLTYTANGINRMKGRASETLLFTGLITLVLALSIPTKPKREPIDRSNG